MYLEGVSVSFLMNFLSRSPSRSLSRARERVCAHTHTVCVCVVVYASIILHISSWSVGWSVPCAWAQLLFKRPSYAHHSLCLKCMTHKHTRTRTHTHRVGDGKESRHYGGNAVADGFGRYRIAEIEHRGARHYARHHCSGKDAGFRLGLGLRVWSLDNNGPFQKQGFRV